MAAGFAFYSNKRIRQSSVFVQAFQHKPLSNKWFSIYLTQSNFEFARLGMVISKKTIPKSVARNVAKRMIREVFRHHSSKLPALDFVIRIRRNVSKINSVEARMALLELMLSSKIL